MLGKILHTVAIGGKMIRKMFRRMIRQQSPTVDPDLPPPNQRSRLSDWVGERASDSPTSFCCWNGDEAAVGREVPPTDKDTYTVVVVGAGVAGLSAALQLRRRGVCDVVVVEAQGRIGGRVKQVEGVAPWPLEAGAEIIHGEHSIVRQLTRNNKHGLHMPASDEDSGWHVYWDDTGEFLSIDEEGVEEYDQVTSIMEQLDEEEATRIPRSERVLDFMLRRGVNRSDKRILDIANAAWANEGGDLETWGAAESVWADQSWVDGDNDFWKEGTFKPLVDWLARDVAVRLEWPVTAIKWKQGTGAQVVGPNGEVISAEAVIVTVPLTQLKRGKISFTPGLPEDFSNMVETISVRNAVKVIAVFKDAFWDRSVHRDKFEELNESFGGMYCPGTNFPTIWMPPNPGQFTKGATPSDYKVLTAFVTNTRAAESLSSMGEEAAVEELLALLDKVFKRRSPLRAGVSPESFSSESFSSESFSSTDALNLKLPAETSDERGRSTSLQGLATESFLKGGLVDWSKEPYIQGGYTEYSVGVGPGERRVLHSVPGGVLFFAGEHTHEYTGVAVQTAMETGRRAAKDTVTALRSRE